jgi:peptide/nickel transport system substrate-binding protein
MEIIKKEDRNEAHPYVPELKELYRGGKISRREFLRNATLLGMSAAAAGTFVTGCAQPTPEATEEPTEEPAATEPPAEEEPAGGPQRGGSLRVASQVQKVTHPAQFSWVSPSNQLRQVAEYLTLTDGDNVTHPWLLESWEASDDLTE